MDTMDRNVKPPGSVAAPPEADSEAVQALVTADAENTAVVLCNDTMAALRSIAHICPHFVTWMRCVQCQRGYFTTGAPGPQPCPACAGGRLLPTSVWDLAHEAAPPGMLRRGEV